MNESASSNASQNTTIIINNTSGILTRDEVEFKLDPLIFKLLSFFRANPQQLITRQQLMQQVWQSPYTSDAAINRSISELRKALGGERNSVIKTLSKKGYCFTAPEEVVFTEKSTAEHTPELLTNIATAPDQPKPPLNNSNSHTAPTLTNKVLAMIGFVTLIIILAISTLQTPANSNHPIEPPIESAITIYIEPIQQTDGVKLNHVVKQLLQDEIINEVLKIEGINIVSQLAQQPSQNQFTLKSNSSETNGELNFSIQLIENQNQQLRYATVMHLGLDNLQQTTQMLSAEMGAILRLSLLESQYVNRYIGALHPLNHQDIEKLIKVRKHINTMMPNGLLYAYNTIIALNKQYPNTAEILGLMSFIQIYYKKNSSYIKQNKPSQLSYGTAALALDPKNFDAMLSLFYYYINTAHLREQAYKFADNLIRYHGDDIKSWRAQLYLHIRTLASCADLQQLVKRIPSGIFTPERLQVISHILSRCQQQQPVTSLLDGINPQLNNRQNKAIYNNLFLFDSKNDEILNVLSQKTRYNKTCKLMTEQIQTHYIAGDTASVQSAIDYIADKDAAFWSQIAELYRAFYVSSSQQNPIDLTLISYDYLYSDVNLVLVAYLTEQVSLGKLTPTVLTEYLLNRPSFVINLANRDETIAAIMAQYASGQRQKSQTSAHRLFEQLENYRQQHPASFYFWSLGRYHLTAKSYCGQPCQTSNDSQYLAKVFGPIHTWWLDDITLMRQVLAPWTTQPLVKDYLSQLELDQTRFKQQLGL